MLLHFVVFAHRSTTTPRSFASRRGKYFLCKLPWNLAARNFGAGKAAGRKLTGRKPETRTKHALKFQPVQACVPLSTEGTDTKNHPRQAARPVYRRRPIGNLRWVFVSHFIRMKFVTFISGFVESFRPSSACVFALLECGCRDQLAVLVVNSELNLVVILRACLPVGIDIYRFIFCKHRFVGGSLLL